MPDFFNALLQAGGGVSGLILAYYLLRLAPELRAIWRALDRRNKIDILRIATSSRLTPEAAQEVKAIVEEIDAEEKAGRKREKITGAEIVS